MAGSYIIYDRKSFSKPFIQYSLLFSNLINIFICQDQGLISHSNMNFDRRYFWNCGFNIEYIFIKFWYFDYDCTILLISLKSVAWASVQNQEIFYYTFSVTNKPDRRLLYEIFKFPKNFVTVTESVIFYFLIIY